MMGGEDHRLRRRRRRHTHEAIDKLELLLRDRLRNGVEVVAAEVPQGVENPWVKYTGMFKDDPMFDEVLEIMKRMAG